MLSFAQYGPWTVTCSLDEVTQARRCQLRAPAPQLFGRESVITIVASPGNTARVAVEAPGRLVAGAPIYLRVDAGVPFARTADRFGRAEWDGADAAALLQAMTNGQWLVIRTFLQPEGNARDEFVSLNRFDEALADYRARITEGSAFTRQ